MRGTHALSSSIPQKKWGPLQVWNDGKVLEWKQTAGWTRGEGGVLRILIIKGRRWPGGLLRGQGAMEGVYVRQRPFERGGPQGTGGNERMAGMRERSDWGHPLESLGRIGGKPPILPTAPTHRQPNSETVA